MNRALAICALLALGCGKPLMPSPPCNVDSDCPSPGDICFGVQGCGNPGTNIVAEVIANARIGRHAQDIPIATIAPQQDIVIFGPMSVAGEVDRYQNDLPATPGNSVKYTGGLTIRLSGQSALIPGVTSRYEATFPSTTGSYSLFVGAGTFTATAIPADASIPPVAVPNVTVTAGQSTTSTASFFFPSATAIKTLNGELLKIANPKTTIPAAEATMTVQAFDPVTHDALSQKFTVSQTGSFTLSISPNVTNGDNVLISAQPDTIGAAAPSRDFIVTTKPLPTSTQLIIGDYGKFVRDGTGTTLVTGHLVASGSSAPIANAQVYLEGTVAGGGTFRTKTVITDDKGQFKVDALPSDPTAPGGTYTVYAFPPPGSLSSILQRSGVKISSTADASTGSALSPETLSCPDKVPVAGTVIMPDGSTPAAGATVTAEPIATVDNNPMPLAPTTAMADDIGRVALQLDPARYRITFAPADGTTGVSTRAVEKDIESKLAATGTSALTVDIGTTQLLTPRVVQGTVTSPQTPLLINSPNVPNASVRFFHVGPVNQKPSALLLGETVTDEQGNYQIVLPTK